MTNFQSWRMSHTCAAMKVLLFVMGFIQPYRGTDIPVPADLRARLRAALTRRFGMSRATSYRYMNAALEVLGFTAP